MKRTVLNRGEPLRRRTPLTQGVPLARKTPLRRVSARRAAQAVEAGKVPVRSTLVVRYRDTGPTRDMVLAVLERDQYSCVRCGLSIHGLRGEDWSVQHRRARQARDVRPDTNGPPNTLILCGSGVSGCHGEVEQRGEADRKAGYWIRQTDDPAQVPVRHAEYGRVYLTADGGVSVRAPRKAAA